LHPPIAVVRDASRHDRVVARGVARPPVPASEFVGFRFPPEVITLAVPPLSLARISIMPLTCC